MGALLLIFPHFVLLDIVLVKFCSCYKWCTRKKKHRICEGHFKDGACCTECT